MLSALWTHTQKQHTYGPFYGDPLPSSMQVMPSDHTSTFPSYWPSSMARITSGAILHGGNNQAVQPFSAHFFWSWTKREQCLRAHCHFQHPHHMSRHDRYEGEAASCTVTTVTCGCCPCERLAGNAERIRWLNTSWFKHLKYIYKYICEQISVCQWELNN